MKTLTLQFSFVAAAATVASCCLTQPAQAASFTFSGANTGFGTSVSGSLAFNEFLTPIRGSGAESITLTALNATQTPTFSFSFTGNAQPQGLLGANAVAFASLTPNLSGATFNFLNGNLVGISGITATTGAVTRSNTITIAPGIANTVTASGTYAYGFLGTQVEQTFSGNISTTLPVATVPYAGVQQTLPLSFTTVQRAVPEPTSVLGILTAMGATTYLKRRNQKQQAV